MLIPTSKADGISGSAFPARTSSVPRRASIHALKVEGMDMNQPTHAYPSSGYLTPSPYDRRDSVASMQSAASCAHSYSSNSPAGYYPTQMPLTPHSSREPMEDYWLMHPNGGVPFDHPTAQDAPRHDLDDFAHEAWQNHLSFPPKPRALESEHQSRPNSWAMVPPNMNPGGLRVSVSEGDGMGLPGSRDFPPFCEPQMAPHAPRTLQPPAEIFSNSEIWNAQEHAAPPNFAMSSMPAEVFAPTAVNSGYNPSYGWPGQAQPAYDLPIFNETESVQPEDTIVDGDSNKYNEMQSDSLDDSFSYDDGYSSTNPEEPLIKQEGDSDYRRDSKHGVRDFMTPGRKGSRRDSKVRASGITKRKMRSGNMLESFDTHHNGCPVEVKYQSGIQVDPKSGRYCSATGETKKQRCRFEGCIKTFARPEHLKRHENTHSKERPFPCVVPHCGRRFSRNDNRKAHYETHLKEALLGKKARNAPVTFDALCTYLHQSEPEDEARKMIEKLQNPKSKMKSRD
ncbi:krueppel-like factor 13-like [Diplodia corticola]|uniref:C2H2 type master regulator of conidiophore development brlA n=1 Tax=Diplodia corticola TaxID=236234 RepID=A0A1J9QMI6_9PEZI|nr:krueppel-like factor 13-like [Diplodia corticola]OJD30086.1 krueppel-like factor 13-like [Diplodia corticola]